MKRLFIGIRIPGNDKLSVLLDVYKNRLKEYRIKWVETENLHLTLRFLGDTEETLIPDINGCLKKVKHDPLNISLKSLGSFRNRAHPVILWIGISPEAGLRSLKKEVDHALHPLNLPQSGNSRFKGHLTVARIKTVNDPRILDELISEHRQDEYFRFSSSAFELIESRLTPSGPVYTVIERFSFT